MKPKHPKRLRILIVEDLPTDAELIERELARLGLRFEARRVETEEAFLAALDELRPDLILSDFKLPTFDGLRALRLTLERAPLTPLIIVTGSMNEETAVECMKAGAADYVLKEQLNRLGPALIGALERRRLLEGRHRAEEELRKLSRAVEQSPISIVVTDTEGRIEYVNPKFTQTTGYRRVEAYGKNPRILKSGEMPPEIYKEMWQTITAGGEWRGELCNRKKNGDLYWERALIGPIRDGAGHITHFLAVKEDITEWRLADAQHHRTQDQLVQAQKMESVGNLAGGVAHDFNNLLNVIQGYAELMLRAEPEDPKARERLGEILKASRRAADLTRQLLAFSRRQVMQPRVIDLSAIVVELEKMLRRLIREDILLDVVRPAAMGRIKADPGQIEQVIMNLCVNARDAMPYGGTLTLELAEEVLDGTANSLSGIAVPGTYVMLAVRDTGCGMSPEVQARIFEPFFTTKEVGKGTGLGLAMVYGVVKQSGGHIWVYSEEGKGTTFKVYFPVVEGTAETTGTTGGSSMPAGAGETILLVEDDDALRNLTQELLVSRGYSVLVAAAGIEALEKAAAYGATPDLLVTDVVMPGMNGPDLVRILRRQYPGLRVLFMSGYTDDALSRQGVLEPGVRLLQKPFTEAVLLQAMRDALTA